MLCILTAIIKKYRRQDPTRQTCISYPLNNHAPVKVKSFYLALKHIEQLTEPLEMNDLALTQVTYDVRGIGIVRDAKYVVVSRTGFLLCRHILHNIRYRVCLALEICRTERNTGRACRIKILLSPLPSAGAI